ncbi:MAG: hypothetical protein PHE89_06450 [Alphaproteobacteria bacterium]|nr:hypothetical protein [Alphaproteobacteria bacterium]
MNEAHNNRIKRDQIVENFFLNGGKGIAVRNSRLNTQIAVNITNTNILIERIYDENNKIVETCLASQIQKVIREFILGENIEDMEILMPYTIPSAS